MRLHSWVSCYCFISGVANQLDQPFLQRDSWVLSRQEFVIRDTLDRLLLFWFGPEHSSSVPVPCPRCFPYMLVMSSALARRATACCLASSVPAAALAVRLCPHLLTTCPRMQHLVSPS